MQNGNGNGNFHVSKVLGVGLLCLFLGAVGKVWYEDHQTIAELKAKAERGAEDRKEIREEVVRLRQQVEARK